MAEFVNIGTEASPVYINVDNIRFVERVKNADPAADEPQTLILVAGCPGDWRLETKVTIEEIHNRMRRYIK